MAEENCALRIVIVRWRKGRVFPATEKLFCSEQCADASQSGSGDCECGHADCQ